MTASKNPVFYKQKAAALMQKNRPQEAIKLLEKFCRKHPTDAEAFYLLGSCNGMLGRHQKAAEALQKSLQIQPHIAQSHFAIGNAFKILNQFVEASEHFRAALKINPRMAETHLALADTLSATGEMDEARIHHEKARDFLPGSGSGSGVAQFGLGNLAEREGKYQESLGHFQQAVKCEPNSPQYLCAAARLLEKLTRWQEARGIYQKVLRKLPEYPDALGGLARICDMTGDHAKIEKYIDPLLEKNIPNTTAGVAFLHACKHLGRCKEAIDYAENLIQGNSSMSTDIQRPLHMASARALDHLGRYEEAFAQLKQGNEQTTLDMEYNTLGHKLAVDNIIDAFNINTFMCLPRAQINSCRPVFIVGMPRSGTSLTEQILAAHPQVEGAGELTDLSDLMKTLPAELSSKSPWPQCIEDAKQDNLDKLARRYLDKLQTVSKKVQRVTDKMPHNFYLLGLIELLFPQAHVIHCRRDPMDTCLSIYFQNFHASHAYAQNLFKLGTHYRQYQRLMEHWRQVLSIPVYDLHYEELVSNPENNIRQLLEFCELEWDNNCLNFHKLERKVATASYDQVRQPLYTHSVERWRHYEPYLDELKEGIERGY